jgi:DNA-binding NarL/FixJ family response regulator
VGRERELAAADAARKTAGGLWLSGPAGAGRTRLAHEIAQRSSALGSRVLWLAATPGMGAVPLGPFRHLLAPDDDADGAEDALWVALERALHAEPARGEVVVVVDDAHHLDDLSAAFVHRLTANRSAFVVLTVRDDLDRPEALTAMWKDGLVERLDIGALGLGEAEAILRFALAGEVERPTVQALWSHSGGNVLLLRELTLSALEDSTLSRKDAIWSWRGRGHASPRLREVVATRLGRLSEAERAALEYVAVGRPLPSETLRVFADDNVIDELEARGLLVAEVVDGTIDLDVSHSVYADVLLAALSAHRLRTLRRQLVHVTARTMMRGPRDAVRLAILRLEAGETVDPVTLRTAATAALWHAGHLLAESLSDSARSQSLPLGSEGGIALRLARAAWEQSGDIESGIELAVTYAWIGQTDNAAALLETIESQATHDEDRARIANARSTLLFWGMGRPDDAMAVLRDAEAACRSIADSSAHRELTRARAGIALNVARPREAFEVSRELIENGPADLATTRARTTVAAALAMLGRCDEALTFVDTYLPTAFEQLDTSPLIAVQLLTARNGAFMRLGRVAESRELADQCLAVALVGESIDGTAVFETWAGRARLAAGDIHGARRHLIEAETLFAERDPLSLHGWALYSTAQASVWGGDLDAAHRALADAAAVRRCARYFDGDLHLARILLATAERRAHDAVDAIAAAVAWATEAEMPVEAAMAWHASVRLDRASECVEPLARLAAQMSNPFVADLAAHANAAARNDADALESVAAAFSARGLFLHAHEAASAARDAYERNGDTRAAQALASRALEFSKACPGAQPSWWSSRRPLPELTRREHEIARLAADGLASRAIADRLVVSVRTVDSHLYRVYTKLGVRDRASLADALAR